uniref:Transient receptor potential cation channel, subfamily A, member 1b n=1 Tax=Cyprinus carpio TaxID=7962 RepID=A0A8C1WSR6_CYPCA
MQFGKEFMRQNSFYKCVINKEEIDLDSADVFELAFKGKASAIDHLSRKNLEHLSFRDENGASPLHYASAGGHLDIIRLIVSVVGPEELNVQDEQGRTPLHWAVEQDQLHSCALLLELGADPNILNSAMMGPLHLAVTKKYNHLVEVSNTCCWESAGVTVRAESSSRYAVCNLTNSENGSPYSATLHFNSLLNSVSLQKLHLVLLSFVISSDYKGWSCLHHAAAEGYTETMKILLAANVKLLDETNEDGNTALHIAAQAGHVSAVMLLLDMGAEISLNNADNSFLHEAVRNEKKDVVNAVIESESKIYSFKTVHFKVFYCIFSIFTFFVAMVRYNRLELLTHPVSQKYLEMKWKVYGSKVHLLNLAVYLLGLLPLTYLILNLRPKQEVFGNNTSVIMVPISFREQKSLISVCIIMVLVFNVYSICKELVQLAQQRINYFTDFSNPADWGAAISSLVFVIPMCFNLENTWQWEAGAFAILTSWIAFLLYFQRFERIGIYVVMFGGIVRTLLCIMILFIFLLLAFGLAFYALMLHQDEFSSISLALAQTFVMTVGELNYQSTFQNAYENGRMAFPGVTYFIFVIFVLLMPILLMNLMIGLAVGDIAEVQRNAELKRIAMQIDLHTALEKKLPYWFLKRVDKPTITIYPNKCKKVLMQALIEGEIQNTVRTRLKLCSRQGGPLERELHKQKNRLKAMSCVLEKQHNLLKLIIQKMEITSEADEYDGPHNPRALKQPTSSSSQKSKWVPLLQAIKAKK